MNFASHRLWDRMPDAIRRDPRKSVVLAALMLTMFVLGVRQFVGVSEPGKASGAVANAIAAPNRTSTVQSARSREAHNTKSGTGECVVQWLGMPIKALDRNLFESKLEYFQRLDATAQDAATVVTDDLFWEQLAKSLASQADQKKQKQIRAENLQLAASSLRLQTTIMGSSPRALVDGRMVSVGDTVETSISGLAMSFRVFRIEGRRILIERENIKLELRMGVAKARVIEE